MLPVVADPDSPASRPFWFSQLLDKALARSTETGKSLLCGESLDAEADAGEGEGIRGGIWCEFFRERRSVELGVLLVLEVTSDRSSTGVKG